MTSSALAATTAVSTATTAAQVSTCFSACAPGPVGLIVSGAVFSAQTGLDYRKYKKGIITKAEFQKRTKRGAFATTGSLVGTTGGMVGGFFAGSLLIPIPVVGGVIGTVIGGLAGGITASKLCVKFYDKLDARLELKKIEAAEAAKEALQKAEEEKERLQMLTDEDETLTYERSLQLLGMAAEDSFTLIHNDFMQIQNNLQTVLTREYCDEESLIQTKKLLRTVRKAIQIIEEHRLAHGSQS